MAMRPIMSVSLTPRNCGGLRYRFLVTRYHVGIGHKADEKWVLPIRNQFADASGSYPSRWSRRGTRTKPSPRPTGDADFPRPALLKPLDSGMRRTRHSDQPQSRQML